MTIEWHPAVSADAPAIAALARAELGDYGEAADLYAERIALAPEGCWVLADGPPERGSPHPSSPGGKDATPAPILGHCISHPWGRFAPPAMHTLLGQLPPDPDCWYLHDVVVAPGARGTKAVERLLPILASAAIAQGIDTLALIGVGGADAYWARQGFVVANGSANGFGKDAVYMERVVVTA